MTEATHHAGIDCARYHPDQPHDDWLMSQLGVASEAQSMPAPAYVYDLLLALDRATESTAWAIHRSEDWHYGESSSLKDHGEAVTLVCGTLTMADLHLTGGPRWDQWIVARVEVWGSINWAQAKVIHKACTALGIEFA